MTKIKFAKLSGENYHTVLGWGRVHPKDKNKNISFPKWIDSWLENYQKAQMYDMINNSIAKEVSQIIKIENINLNTK
ncbi:hypothetical protein [Malaciobacter molluscorum]|uniref:hypothetical protein n=1 Tax=Malaciobacter molluscorum TaxID=1032072 RepID=UPI0013E9859B|nr:hypothetical protein [Malaciobacter molluscorum]